MVLTLYDAKPRTSEKKNCNHQLSAVWIEILSPTTEAREKISYQTEASNAKTPEQIKSSKLFFGAKYRFGTKAKLALESCMRGGSWVG